MGDGCWLPMLVPRTFCPIDVELLLEPKQLHAQNNYWRISFQIADPSPTLCQPFANLFCQPLFKPLFPWAPGTGLETRVNGFLVCGIAIGAKTITRNKSLLENSFPNYTQNYARQKICANKLRNFCGVHSGGVAFSCVSGHVSCQCYKC